MLTSNVQMGYVLTRGGGQAVQGGLSCLPPRISERMDNTQILVHHLLQEYLVERDINFISVNLRCLLQTFSWVMYWQGVGGKLSRAVYLAPPPRISGVSDSGARGPGFETYRCRVVSLSKTLYSPKVLVNYPGSGGSVPTWLKNCWLGR